MSRLPARIARLGRVEYVATATLQRSLRAARAANAMPDMLLMLEHDPVITCGRVTEAHEIAFARTTDIPLVPVERGGKATYHGPHQVVAYPIMSLDLVDGDVKELVRRIEQAVIDALDAHGITSARRPDYPGVWVDLETARPRKIASLGLRLSGGVTFHGVAVNVANDLTPFGWFTPCGIPDAEMTSVVRELGAATLDAAATEQLVARFAEALETNLLREFGLDATPIDTGELAALAERFPLDEPALTLPGEPRTRNARRIEVAASERA
ncbi:MAG: lipoyl(octanoyl) transferase LipB [Thermoleophilia bacterium]|nr:lipoyl(octanoyl) transferase LipB [Thermoleophilia bacterium]